MLNDQEFRLFVGIGARLAEIATYLRLLSANTGPIPIDGKTVPDVVKAANLEGTFQEDIWMPRVLSEIADASNVYKYPQAQSAQPSTGSGLAGLATALTPFASTLAPGVLDILKAAGVVIAATASPSPAPSAPATLPTPGGK